MARGVEILPESGTMYGYARVDMTWMNQEFDEDEIDIPCPNGNRYMRSLTGEKVLWNKSNIMLDEVTPVSMCSKPSPSPSSDPSDDDDDNSDDDYNNNAGPGSSPRASLPPGNSSP